MFIYLVVAAFTKQSFSRFDSFSSNQNLWH